MQNGNCTCCICVCFAEQSPFHSTQKPTGTTLGLRRTAWGEKKIERITNKKKKLHQGATSIEENKYGYRKCISVKRGNYFRRH